MKSRILQIVAILFLSFSLMIDICSAVEIVGPNIQLDFCSDEAGVYYTIKDPQGRRIGYDLVTKQYVEEFPASFGFSLKVRDEISEKYCGEAMFNLIPGTYTIEVIGVGLTTFDVSIAISRRIPGEGFTDFNFEGIIDKDLTSK
ncbi:MAG: hypothetical protein HY805_00980 [Nitrospirae bacterium]|nr:hypothetical protein [Nitrospirota bacterium]